MDLSSLIKATRTECAGNYHFDVNGHVRDTFDLGMALAFRDHTKAAGFVADTTSFTLYWYIDGSADKKFIQRFPYDLNFIEAGHMVWGWLQQDSTEWGSEPDIDGSCSKGFRITNQQCSFGSGKLAIVTPCWMLHGK